jgi:hypothetical protein
VPADVPLQQRKKAAHRAAFLTVFTAQNCAAARLLHLAFFIRHVLAHDWVVFGEFQFFRHGPRVFLGHIEMTGIGGAYQFDANGRGFSHRSNPFLLVRRPPPFGCAASNGAGK